MSFIIQQEWAGCLVVWETEMWALPAEEVLRVSEVFPQRKDCYRQTELRPLVQKMSAKALGREEKRVLEVAALRVRQHRGCRLLALSP